MSSLTRIVLDVLKPHQPNALEFANGIAEATSGARVKLRVVEMDEKTETIVLEIEGKSIEYNAVADVISKMAGSIRSIDEVDVLGTLPINHNSI